MVSFSLNPQPTAKDQYVSSLTKTAQPSYAFNPTQKKTSLLGSVGSFLGKLSGMGSQTASISGAYGSPKPVPAPTVFDYGTPGTPDYIPAQITPASTQPKPTNDVTSPNQLFAGSPSSPLQPTNIYPYNSGYTGTSTPQTAPKIASAPAAGASSSSPAASAPAASASPAAGASTGSFGTPTGGGTTLASLGTGLSSSGSIPSAYDQAFQAYLQSLQETEQEKAARKKYNELVASTQLGLSDIENKAIPLQFITGQQRALEGRAAALAAPLEAQLAQEENIRQRMSQGNLARVQFEQQKLKDAEAAGKPMEVGGSLVKFNPATGQYDVVYAGKPDYASGSIGEYQFYADQERAAGRNPVSFNDYQNMDANRKAKVAAAGVAQANGLTSAQTQNFLRITDKFQADQVMAAGNNGANAIAIADTVLANPGNAANQLQILYTLVKSLDPNSAVREGEISLAQQTQSYLSKFQNQLAKIDKGQVIGADAAKQLAEATKQLANLWFTAAQRRQNQYQSQAQVAGVGDAFRQYNAGYEQPYNNPTSTTAPGGKATDEDIKFTINSVMNNIGPGKQYATREDLMKALIATGAPADRVSYFIYTLIPDKR